MKTRQAVSGSAVADLIVSGGDERIVPDPVNGLNRYGLPPRPLPAALDYASSTASAISEAAFDHVGAVAQKLQDLKDTKTAPAFYAREMDRLRERICALVGLKNTAIVFSDSGTTAHLVAAQLADAAGSTPLSIVMMEPSETGRAVSSALDGTYFTQRTPLDNVRQAFREIPVHKIALRDRNGVPRNAADVDDETENRANEIVAQGGRVLINAVDVSKTGLIGPGCARLIALKRRFGPRLDIVLDACQFRLTPEKLHRYLEENFAVAVTGSKFFTGPIFSGALLLPPSLTRRWGRKAPATFSSYLAQGDWPAEWPMRSLSTATANFGLLLRWEAALFEIQEFFQLPGSAVARLFRAFAEAVQSRIEKDSAFAVLPVPALNRDPFSSSGAWDEIQTIFPFLLLRDGRFLTREETQRVYERAIGPKNGIVRCGQPVECGSRDGIPVSALRLCMSARLAVDALSPTGRGAAAVIGEGLDVLGELARLANET